MTKTMPGDAEVMADARARTRAALAAAERLRVTVDAAGADIAREREKNLSESSVFVPHQNETVAATA